MPNIKIVLNPINVTQDVVLIVEKVAALGALVFTTTFHPPHSQRNYTIADLEPAMYRLFFWESPVGSGTLQTLLGSVDIDATFGDDAILEVLELIVGGGGPTDPIPGESFVKLDKLLGVDLATPGVEPTRPVYQVFQRGVGPKLSNEIQNGTPAGDPGFSLLGGDKFSEEDVFVVNIYRKKTATAGAALTSFFGDIIRAEDEVNIDPSYFNKKVVLAGLGAVHQVNFPALATIPERRYFIFDTHEGGYTYALLKFADSGIVYRGEKLSEFFMPRGVEICFAIEEANSVKQATVIWYTGNDRHRGRVIMDEIEGRVGYLPAIGSVLTKAAYPGIYAWVAAQAPGFALSFAEWDADVTIGGKTGKFNRSRWAIDATAGAERIRLPDRRLLVQKALPLGLADDGARAGAAVGGSLQLDRVGAHEHKTNRPRTKRGGGSDPNHALHVGGGEGGNFGANVDFYSGAVHGGATTDTTLIRTAGGVPLVTL